MVCVGWRTASDRGKSAGLYSGKPGKREEAVSFYETEAAALEVR